MENSEAGATRNLGAIFALAALIFIFAVAAVWVLLNKVAMPDQTGDDTWVAQQEKTKGETLEEIQVRETVVLDSDDQDEKIKILESIKR